MVKQIMVRSAEDAFIALKTANAMESVGASVFALTNAGSATYEGALAPHQKFQVWSKVDSLDMIDAADKAIGKQVYGVEEEEEKCSTT